MSLRCEFCGSGGEFWSLSGKFSDKIGIGDVKVSRRNDAVYHSILGGRIIGVGNLGLKIYHSLLGIGLPPLHFERGQKDVLIAAQIIARETMDRAVGQLIDKKGKDEGNFVHDIASFDGSYQRRSTKGGGVYSRYCFGSIISIANGKILAYDIACNSCRICTHYSNLFDDFNISEVEYKTLMSLHSANCPATFGKYLVYRSRVSLPHLS